MLKIVELLKKNSDRIQRRNRCNAAIANLQIDQSATFTSDVTVKDANGNAFDLLYQEMKRQRYQSTKTRQDITTTIGFQTEGKVTLSLTETRLLLLKILDTYMI